MANNKPTFVVTGTTRLSYANLTRPYAREGQDPKYSVTLLIPKHDTATLQRINAAIEAATLEGVAGKWGGQRPPIIATPLHDGDGGRPSDGTPFGDECKGHYVMTASSKQKPEVVDANLNPLINESEIYSGMYARVSINFFAYNSSGKKGVGVGLGNVQKIQDGESLAGRTSASDDFGGAPAPAAPPQQYAQPATPAQPQYGQQQPQINPITGQPMGPYGA